MKQLLIIGIWFLAACSGTPKQINLRTGQTVVIVDTIPSGTQNNGFELKVHATNCKCKRCLQFEKWQIEMAGGSLTENEYFYIQENETIRLFSITRHGDTATIEPFGYDSILLKAKVIKVGDRYYSIQPIWGFEFETEFQAVTHDSTIQIEYHIDNPEKQKQ